MHRLVRLLTCAALTMAPAPAGAQPPETPDSGKPAAFQAMVDQVRRGMMAPGPVVERWKVGGADPTAALVARGADRHVMLVEDENGTTVSFSTDRRIADLAAPGWRVVDTYGSPVAYAENPTIGFSPVGTRFVVGARTAGWRENGLDCGKQPTHAILYERSDAPADQTTDQAMTFFRITMLAMEGQTICSRAVGDSRRGWRLTYLLPDGRALPAFNKNETRMRIVPAGPIDRLVVGTSLAEIAVAAP